MKYARKAHLFSLIRDTSSEGVRAEGRMNYSLNSIDKENIKAGLRRALRMLIAVGAVEEEARQSDGHRFKYEDTS